MSLDHSSYISTPRENTTLLLSKFWLPINITNAREAIKKLVTGGTLERPNPNVKVIDANYELLHWEEWIDPSRASYYQDQPFMRSAHNIYPVPTIMVTAANWAYRAKQKPSLRHLYKHFKGKCQICGNKFPIGKMTIEHILPKSKHGTNDGFNLTLTCKTCNSRKGSIYPYLDYTGKELEAPKLNQHFEIPAGHRQEWAAFVFKEKDRPELESF